MDNINKNSNQKPTKDTPDILKKIIKRKFEEVALDEEKISLKIMQEDALKIDKKANFYQSLKQKIDNKQNAVIAEIKKASPSKGILRENFDPAQIAKDYQEAGATCLSVLTDKDFFKGSDEYLQQVVGVVDLPVLRKDFIISNYQIYQAKVLGADCILLIAAVLTLEEMLEFVQTAKSVNLDVLVEVHNKVEMLEALKLDLPMIGINNRNLRDFSVSLETTLELMKLAKGKVIITESGILSEDDVNLMNDNDIYGFLVGEAFMKKDDIVSGFNELF
jgi:indole-3-glycerol phosphate synthase